LFLLFTSPPSVSVYILSLHDALPISRWCALLPVRLSVRPPGASSDCRRPRTRAPNTAVASRPPFAPCRLHTPARSRHGANGGREDRKSTRLNSSHEWISYAVFCLKKK